MAAGHQEPSWRRVPPHLTSTNPGLANSKAAWCFNFVRMPARSRECLAGAGYPSSIDGFPSVRPSISVDNPGVTADAVTRLCEQGQLGEAVEALEVLVDTGCHVSKSVFYAAMKECVDRHDLALGRRVHALTVKKGFESETFLCNRILRMYAFHGRLQEAMGVFTMAAKPDAFTWAAIISAHVKHGQDKLAVELYHGMRRSSVKPNGHVFVAALQACAKGADLRSGQEVHADVLASGVEPDLFVCSGLVDMYAKCGSLEDAQRVFDGLERKNVVTWNAMIAGYSQQGMGQKALGVYKAMREEGVVTPSSVTFVCLLQACASMGVVGLEKGKELHGQIRERGLQGDVVVRGSLVNMYAKCGSLVDARRVFDGLSRKNVVLWNTMIAGYAQQGMGQEALRLYTAMQEECRVALDSVTFVSLLQACASVGASALEKGRQLHAQIKERGLQADVFVGNSLVNMYAKCGSLDRAQGVFDGLPQKDVVTWSAMIAGYSQQGRGQEALRVYSAMQQEGMVTPNSVTYACLLQACASVRTPGLEKGRQLHAEIRDQGLEADVFVASSLVNMYAKCGSLEDAQEVFDGLPQKDVVMWSAMIAGYSQQGMGQEALRVYRSMQQEGIVAPDSVTFVCLLQACANVAALSLGRQIHAQIKHQGLQDDELIPGSLINMYGKCGSMSDALEVFEALSKGDISAWNALIVGYTQHGDGKQVFELVLRMREDGIRPDGVTLLSILTVCSHTGLVSKAQECFEAMSKQDGITPTVDHYTCMVDLLGRAGQLDEALGLIRAMPVQPDAAVWHTLLGACRKWNNAEVGLQAFKEAVKLDKKNPAAYSLMSNIYTGAQMWQLAEEMQATRLRTRAWKQPGQSWWTDMEGLVHSFVVGETS